MAKPTLDQMLRELKEAGWKKSRPKTLWKSPAGYFHYGPIAAYLAMKVEQANRNKDAKV